MVSVFGRQGRKVCGYTTFASLVFLTLRFRQSLLSLQECMLKIYRMSSQSNPFTSLSWRVSTSVFFFAASVTRRSTIRPSRRLSSKRSCQPRYFLTPTTTSTLPVSPPIGLAGRRVMQRCCLTRRTMTSQWCKPSRLTQGSWHAARK